MNQELLKILASLQADFTAETGRPFKHFFCPILYRDEETELCKGHIVNKAFKQRSGRTTVQRKDVDNFFGRTFESRFVQIRHRGKRRLEDFITDKDLARHFSPTFLVDDQPIPHFLPKGPVPTSFSEVALLTPQGDRRLALKIAPSELMEGQGAKLTFSIRGDLRLSAVGTLLKAAHLTLFDLLGYRYVFTPGGHFLGREALGEFFLSNRDLDIDVALSNALVHFRQFIGMVRPLEKLPKGLQGTLRDRRVLVCRVGAGLYWALIVFIRTGASMHAVLTPIFDHPEGAATYLERLSLPSHHLTVHLAAYENGTWQVDTRSFEMFWPPVEAGF